MTPTGSRLVRKQLEAKDVRNVTLNLRTDETYADVEDRPDGSFDFALVDGMLRDRCAATAIRKVRERSYLYLDNSDNHPNQPDSETRRAEQLLLAAASHAGSKPEYFLDLPGAVLRE